MVYALPGCGRLNDSLTLAPHHLPRQVPCARMVIHNFLTMASPSPVPFCRVVHKVLKAVRCPYQEIRPIIINVKIVSSSVSCNINLICGDFT